MAGVTTPPSHEFPPQTRRDSLHRAVDRSPRETLINLAPVEAPSLAGTWTMNTAKPHYSPRAVPKRESVIYESSNDGFTYKVTATEADDSPTNLTGTLVFDGKDVPTTGSPITTRPPHDASTPTP